MVLSVGSMVRSSLTMTVELLSERGVGGFTVDEVARRSGVAKTTIYRYWPTREALVIDACSRISAEQEVPDTGSVEGDVTAILANIAHLVHGDDRRQRDRRSRVKE
jgi:AcrR family transcriptional regulator